MARTKPAADPDKERAILLLEQLLRMADSLERLTVLAEALATRSGLNVKPTGLDVDESFAGTQVETSEEELVAYKQRQSPPVPDLGH